MTSKYVRFSIRNSVIQKKTFSVRAVFHGECVLDSFNMAISGTKTTFYTLCMKSKYVRITNRNLNFFTVISLF